MPLNLDALRDKKAKRSTSGWSPKEGDNRIRILPHTSKYFTESLGEITVSFHSHWLKAEGVDTTVVRCLRDRGEPCPLCMASKKFKDSPDPNLKKNADETRQSERHLFNILDLNDPAKGIQVYESGPSVYDQILSTVANPAWGDVLGVADGRNWTLNLNKKGRGGFYEYKALADPDRTDVCGMLTPDFMEKLDELESSVPEYPTTELVTRWLDLLGFSGNAPAVTTAVSNNGPVPVSAAQPAPVPVSAPAPAPVAVAQPLPVATPVAAPAPVPVSAQPASTAAGPLGQSPVVEFLQKHNISPAQKRGKLVPECFSDGPAADKASNFATGFKPEIRPCHECPERAQCQIVSLGLQ